ncbi:hypothetical protein CEE44_04840 [Candidatus Woesearchaeota archaeon B3_Woes]|nr:MAG: hypothetical protein CEE44_04840 [Candidatus Woesearchaeota archaeon B3_Woes]
MNIKGDKLSGTPMVVFLVKTIGIIGAGCLGQEVIDALYNKGHRNIIATRRNQDKLRSLGEKYQGIQTSSDNNYAAKESDVLILAVKPPLIDTVSKEISYYTSNKLVISLAAARTIEQIEYAFSDESARVARVITGLFVAEEVAAYTLSNRCINEDESAIRYIFGQDARSIEENLLAHRTFIACDTGLIPKSIGEKMQELERLGISKEESRLFYAATLHAIANHLSEGISGEEIYEAVGGKGSFTQKLGNEQEGIYRLQQKQVTETVNACLGRKENGRD